jgi:hypothetical protein
LKTETNVVFGKAELLLGRLARAVGASDGSGTVSGATDDLGEVGKVGVTVAQGNTSLSSGSSCVSHATRTIRQRMGVVIYMFMPWWTRKG